MECHDEDVDVEGVDEPDVDHLEVGRLRHQLVDRRLDCGENGHDRDRDHDSILEKGYFLYSCINRFERNRSFFEWTLGCESMYIFEIRSCEEHSSEYTEGE